MRDGRVEAYATDRLILVGEVLGGPVGAKLFLTDEYLSVESYSLMMRRDADLRLAVNRALAEIYRSGDIVAVFRQTFGPDIRPTPILEAAFVINALPERLRAAASRTDIRSGRPPISPPASHRWTKVPLRPLHRGRIAGARRPCQVNPATRMAQPALHIASAPEAVRWRSLARPHTSAIHPSDPKLHCQEN